MTTPNLNIYSNIINDLKGKENYKHIVKSSRSNKHFSIVYNFSPNYIDQVADYTGIVIEDYKTVNDFVTALEDSGFKCK